MGADCIYHLFNPPQRSDEVSEETNDDYFMLCEAKARTGAAMIADTLSLLRRVHTEKPKQ